MRNPLQIIALLLALLILAACAPAQPTEPAEVAETGIETSTEPTVDTTATEVIAQEVSPTEILPTEVAAQSSSEPAAEPTPAPVDPNSVALDLAPVIQGLAQPLFVTHAGDGTDRLFVVEKGGRILVFGPERSQGEVFLNIADRLRSDGFEQGLLGLAFSPNYAESGHFFVNYTDRQGDTVVSRFSVSGDANRANPDSEFMVMSLPQPASNHNGGMVAFGPDGYLYIGTGDGGRANDAFGHGQNPSTLLGAMLRVDVTSDPSQPYTIPADNPWVSETWNGQEVQDEIWAVGLRNPWRYSFDRETEAFWIADVGQNQYEEVNWVGRDSLTQGGLNFGWPITEGLHCFQSGNCATEGQTLPVVEYDHGQGCSITGGYVYRGAASPSLDGAYFYGDYCSGRIWAHWSSGPDGPVTRALLDSGLTVSSFGEDEQGEVYVTDLSGGSVYQLVGN